MQCPFVVSQLAALYSPHIDFLQGRGALRSRIKRKALTAILKGNHMDNSVQWLSLLRLRHRHLSYCLNKSTATPWLPKDSEMQKNNRTIIFYSTASHMVLFFWQCQAKMSCAKLESPLTITGSMLRLHDRTFEKFCLSVVVWEISSWGALWSWFNNYWLIGLWMFFFPTPSTASHQQVAENVKKCVFQANVESNIKPRNVSENLALLKLLLYWTKLLAVATIAVEFVCFLTGHIVLPPPI